MFLDDVASMGQLAARNFEDILQCCLPVFKGLLPLECNAPVQRLLFTFAFWHGLAKLCCHTTETLKIMKKLTAKLGSKLRSFAELTQNMNVCKTPDKYMRCYFKREIKGLGSFGDSRWPALMLLQHQHLQDSYSTQIYKLQHCFIKDQFERTNKKDVVKQMTQIGDVSSALKRMELELEQRAEQLRSQIGDSAPPSLNPEGLELLLNGSPYTIGQTKRSEDLIPSITRWVREQQHNDAMKSEDGSTSPHPFIYAKVLGIYHAQVSYGNAVPCREDFVHVRWLYYDTDKARQGGWDECQLDHIGYEQCCTDQDLLDLFDFVHPSNIIRAVHLIPDFRSGSSGTLLSFAKLVAHNSKDPEHWDWKHYYVNRFVDRDMLMRYLGGGIGHYLYATCGSDVTLGSKQNANKTTEVPLGTGGEGESGNMESKGQRSKDKRSNGGKSICLAQDNISNEEEPSMDNGATKYGDNVLEDEMEGYAIDENEDVLYGF
ncbi:hypothetical protein RHS04_09358 [Rhizoctonia solani]|uniref:Uncharacterized protein n=1 Tax=Rhizoctonia solani TaxID=456999 RepID=A0A8H7GZE5_9AGAM|nr:hypothetical protein RHS04_09358 [Rhizoctonia solani]